MCSVYREGRAVRVLVVANGTRADCPIVNYGGVGGVLVGMEPAMWPVRRELMQFPGLLQMVRGHAPEIRCLKLSTES